MNNLNKYLIGAVVALLLVCAGAFIHSSNLKRANNNWKHNYEVLRDSMELVVTQSGEILYENGSLIIEKKELEAALDISKKQVKDYEKTLGSKLAYISKLESQVGVRDTITVTKVIHDTLTNSYSMNYDDGWLKFDQRFSMEVPDQPTFNIYNINMNVPLKVGLTNDYTIFVTSPNPYFKVTSIEGAVIDKGKFAPRPKHWMFGVYGGFGAGYGLINKQFDVGPQIGVGVGYIFF